MTATDALGRSVPFQRGPGAQQPCADCGATWEGWHRCGVGAAPWALPILLGIQALADIASNPEGLASIMHQIEDRP